MNLETDFFAEMEMSYQISQLEIAPVPASGSSSTIGVGILSRRQCNSTAAATRASVSKSSHTTMSSGTSDTATSESAATPEPMDLEVIQAALQTSTLSKSRMENPFKKKFSKHELKAAFIPIFQKLESTPECAPFKFPVDPKKMYDHKKHEMNMRQMDFYTIRVGLDQGVYAEPWAIIEDIRQVYDNTLNYGRKKSYVYSCAQMIAKLFDADVDGIMRKLGYCCGQNRVYNPRTLTCNGSDLCSIPRWAEYHSYDSGKYSFCQNCFNKINGSTVTVTQADSPDAVPREIPKTEFTLVKNSDLLPEPFIVCRDCERKFHTVCVLHHEALARNGFRCGACLKSFGGPAVVNQYTAQKLPYSEMGAHIERNVNAYLKRKSVILGLEVGSVCVRVLSSCDKAVEIKPNMKQRFHEAENPIESFPYRSKAIFAFTTIDGADVMFFALYAQEYGSDCPQPNKRRVYISYVDSLNFFQPKELRTRVYQEIILGYLEYVKQRGFSVAHVWSCPADKGEDYIFNAHPADMKMPNAKRLQDWYRRLLDRGAKKGIVVSYQDLFAYVMNNDEIKSPLDIPYFEGDYWPPVLEKAAVEMVEGKSPNANTGGQRHTGKANGISPPKKKKISAVTVTGSNLTLSFISELKNVKENFFVVRLSKAGFENLLDTLDPDPVNDKSMEKYNTVGVEERSTFLVSACDSYREFSSLRRAKFSTMAILYELHTIGQPGSYTCNRCMIPLRIRFKCTVCKDFDLCPYCYENEQHPHKMALVLPPKNPDTSRAPNLSLRTRLSSESRPGSRSNPIVIDLDDTLDFVPLPVAIDRSNANSYVRPGTSAIPIVVDDVDESPTRPVQMPAPVTKTHGPIPGRTPTACPMIEGTPPSASELLPNRAKEIWWKLQVDAITHAPDCQNPKCSFPECSSMTVKLFHKVHVNCDAKSPCNICRFLHLLAFAHAKSCVALIDKCRVPDCNEIRRTRRIIGAKRPNLENELVMDQNKENRSEQNP